MSGSIESVLGHPLPTPSTDELSIGPFAGEARRMLAYAGLVLALMLVSTAACARELPSGFDPQRDALQDFASAIAVAKAERKRVLVEVGGEWCAWCRIMDRFFAANDDAKSLRDRHYVWLKVNVSKANLNEALLARWPAVGGYPHIFVVDADGTLLHSQDTSLLEHGKAYDKPKFVAFLQRFAR